MERGIQSKSSNRPLHIFEIIQALYPELHRKMMESINKDSPALKRTLNDIEKFKKDPW